MKRLLLSFAGLVLSASFALAQVGGGTPVYQNWFPQADSPAVSVSSTSAAFAWPGVGPTARVCNRGSVDAYINPNGVDNTVVATINNFWILAGTCQVYNLKPNNLQYLYFAAITASSSTSLYIETGLGSPSASSSGGSPPAGLAGGQLSGFYPNPNVIGYSGTTLPLAGASSGIINLNTQSAAGTYNFNLPTTAGSSGQVLASGGGSSAPMTWVDAALYVPSVSGLSTARTDIGIASVPGYYAGTTVGGGVFILQVSSATTDSCSIFASADGTKRWFRQWTYMTAFNCGAHGDGVTLGGGVLVGTCAFTDATAHWISGDAGTKREQITPPIGTIDASYDGIISVVNSTTSITLTAPCPSWSATSVEHTKGTNDTAAFAALNAWAGALQSQTTYTLPGGLNNVVTAYVDGPYTYLVEGTFHIADSATTARNMTGIGGTPTISIGNLVSNTPAINFGGINAVAMSHLFFNAHYSGDTVVGTASDMLNWVGGSNGGELDNITLYNCPRDCVAMNYTSGPSIQQGKTKVLITLTAGRDDWRTNITGPGGSNYANEFDNDTTVLGNPSSRFAGGRYFTVGGGDGTLTSWFTHNFKFTTGNIGFTPDPCPIYFGASTASPGLVFDSGYVENGGTPIGVSVFPICVASGKTVNYHMRNFDNLAWGYQGNIQNFDGGGRITLGGGATTNIQNVGSFGQYSSFNMFATNLGRNGSNYIANWPIFLYGGGDSFSPSPSNSTTAGNSFGGSSVTLAVTQSGGTATLTATNNTATTGSSFSVTSNVVSYTAAVSVNLLVGDTVVISSSADATLDGTHTITGGSGATFTFALTHANVGSTPDTSATVKLPSTLTWYNQIQNGISIPVPN